MAGVVRKVKTKRKDAGSRGEFFVSNKESVTHGQNLATISDWLRMSAAVCATMR
jgi:hypothetical protein